ncbi:MAG: triose-phosphate isomerase [Chloroflexi bacterium]|nr:triose-phosphate isomerase [Chloroflexota bacterium]
MATPFIAGNWKMNTTLREAVALVREMRGELARLDGVERVLCPPFISLAAVSELVAGTPIKVGAQNLFHEQKGAYTGEVSPLMLRDLCEYVIVGHSERRACFHEDDAVVNRKLKAAVAAGLRPILCVGERLGERESGRAEEVVTAQLHRALEGYSDAASLVVAYEPVWAIGTGKAATPDMAGAMMALIRRRLSEAFGDNPANGIPLLYGGSVTSQNIRGFVEQPPVDGALVGGASLRAADFVEIVRTTAQVRARM